MRKIEALWAETHPGRADFLPIPLAGLSVNASDRARAVQEKNGRPDPRLTEASREPAEPVEPDLAC